MQIFVNIIVIIMATLGLSACTAFQYNNEPGQPVIIETAIPAPLTYTQPQTSTPPTPAPTERVEPQNEQTLQKINVDATPVNKELVGGSIERSMDQNDKMKMSRALDKSPGKPTSWTNTNTGIHYDVTPIRKVVIKDNPFCREYQATTKSSTRSQQTNGTACIGADGNWHTID